MVYAARTRAIVPAGLRHRTRGVCGCGLGSATATRRRACGRARDVLIICSDSQITPKLRKARKRVTQSVRHHHHHHKDDDDDDDQTSTFAWRSSCVPVDRCGRFGGSANRHQTAYTFATPAASTSTSRTTRPHDSELIEMPRKFCTRAALTA